MKKLVAGIIAAALVLSGGAVFILHGGIDEGRPPADGSCDYFIYLPDGSEAGCYSDSGSSLERVGMGCNGGALIIRYRPGEQRTHFKELYYRSSKEFTSQGCYCNKPLSQIGSIVARISYSTSIFPAGMHWRLYGVKY